MKTKKESFYSALLVHIPLGAFQHIDYPIEFTVRGNKLKACMQCKELGMDKRLKYIRYLFINHHAWWNAETSTLDTYTEHESSIWGISFETLNLNITTMQEETNKSEQIKWISRQNKHTGNNSCQNYIFLAPTSEESTGTYSTTWGVRITRHFAQRRACTILKYYVVI